MLNRLDSLDRRLFLQAARGDTPALDAVLPRLTSSADHGGLWILVSALLALSGQRRAAVRGLMSLGVASAVSNLPAKGLARRKRPGLAGVPLARQLLQQPTTSSFPSGHSASAGAFALGVALEQPGLGVPVGVLAAGVAYGRVYTGVHYPGDVAVGLGVGVASALAVKRVWPVRPDRPAASRTATEAPALPNGEGFVLVVNKGGGSADQLTAVRDALEKTLPKAELVESDGDLDEALRKAAARATVLGIMGGDGSINCAAGVAMDAGLPLAVVPGGTLNHFAGELGIATAEEVFDAVRRGSAVRISVGSAQADGDGLFFLNTFALGVYPELVKEREKHEDRLGKWPAMALATARIMRKAQPVCVRVDGEERRLWTLFAGNGHYHPAGFAPSWRERMDDGSIDIRLMDATSPFSRTRLTLALLTGRLGRSRLYEERVVGRLSVTADGPLRIARDGEVSDGPAELKLRAVERSLVVYRS